MKKPKRPRDPNQLAKSVVELATEEDKSPPQTQIMSIQDVARLGGLKGGKARARALTAVQRSRIARLAAKARWGTKKR